MLAAFNRQVQFANHRINRRSDKFLLESRVTCTDAIDRHSKPRHRFNRCYGKTQGPHVIYLLPASSALTFPRRRPFSSRLRAAASLHSCRRRRSTPPARTRFTHRRASHHRAFFTPPLIHARAARLSLPPTPPVRATAATHCCASQHHRHELRAAPAPHAAHAANTPRRSRSRSTFSLSARQVFEVLPV